MDMLQLKTLFHTLFEYFDLEINNVPIVKNGQYYGYLANFLRTLGTDVSLKKTFYQSEYYYENNKKDAFGSGNDGYQARKSSSASSANIVMNGTLLHGLLQTGINELRVLLEINAIYKK